MTGQEEEPRTTLPTDGCGAVHDPATNPDCVASPEPPPPDPATLPPRPPDAHPADPNFRDPEGTP